MHVKALTYGVGVFVCLLSLSSFCSTTAYAATASASITVTPTEANMATVTPDNSNIITTGITTVRVVTSNSFAYTLSLSSKTANTAMASSDASHSGTIPTLNVASSLGSTLDDRWGYCFGSATCALTDVYNPVVPNGSSAVLIEKETISAKSANDTYTLTFGARVSMNLPSGEYENTQVISLVADDSDTLADISYMQDITPKICKYTSTGTTKRLTDRRDNNRYWVAKLADGHCWMIQNLALDITAAGLSAANTDISYDWTAAQNGDGTIDTVYGPVATQSLTTNNNPLSTSTHSWNFGKYVMRYPLAGTSLCATATSFANCSNTNFVDVSASQYQDTYTATNSGTSLRAEYNIYVIFFYITRQYDAHYLMGNYYTWNAATAGTGGETTSGEAAGSICPAGWGLPSSSGEGSFAGLLNAYSLTSSSASVLTLGSAPLHFFMGGYVNSTSSSLAGIGTVGNYWTSTPSANTETAYSLNITPTSLSSVNESSRNSGHFVRCML